MPTAQAVVRLLRPQRVRERLHTGLGSAVRAHQRGGAERGEGGDLEVVARRLPQVGQEGVGREGAAGEVHVDDAAPGGHVFPCERAALGDTGVRDDDRRRAQPGTDPVGGLDQGLLVGDVGLDGEGRRRQRGGDGLQGEPLVAEQGQPGAPPGEGTGLGGAQAARGARDDDGAVLQRAVRLRHDSLRSSVGSVASAGPGVPRAVPVGEGAL
ncbi:hypothetical protein RKD18_007309 [Streptomyces phaeoluteigriseus]